MGAAEAEAFQRHFNLPTANVDPRVYFRITHNWLELTVRFLTRTHGVRELKSEMSRDILDRFDAEGIAIATTTLEIKYPGDDRR